MTKRKRKAQNGSDIKKIRTEIIDFSFNNTLGNDSSISLSLSNTHKHVQNRKEKRKEERLLKKARKHAFSQRKVIPTKQDFLKAKEEIALDEQNEIKLKRKKEEKKKEKKDKKKQKEKKKRKIEEKRQKEEEEIDAVKKRDNQEIHDLEKKLHLNKRKSKTLPQSFLDDGLDYILDIVDSDKLDDLANDEEESDLEAEFKGTVHESDDYKSNEDLGEFGSDLDDEEDLEEGVDSDDDDDDDDDDDGNRDDSDNTSVKNPDKQEKWEKLAEKIKQVVKSTKKVKGIIKEKATFETTLDGHETDMIETEEQTKVKKTVSFADDPVEKTTNSETSNSPENTDSDSLLSSDSNGDFDLQDISAVPDMHGVNIAQLSDKKGPDDSGIKEDIYGRLRDTKGNLIRDNVSVIGGAPGAYIPPGKRAQMIAGTDEKRKIHLDKLRKQMKGLVNRASEANMQLVSSQIEELYLSNSRADVNETLVSLIFDLCVTMAITPERLSMELMMLVALLHGNVGSEVGAHFLQSLVKKFDDLQKVQCQSMGKELENVVILLSHLYNFKVVHGVLMFDLLKLLTDRFQEKEVELILLIMKNIGFSLRKDDPAGLKDMILSIQTKASSVEGMAMRDESRIRFMLDILLAIRNNNMRKIPNYDPEHLHHLQKLMKGFLRGGEFGDNQLHVTLQDLINAENKGKWWIVGSAWEGQGPKQALKEHHTDASLILQGVEISSKLQELAKKQRMNTDKRRTIFYVIMTSEDYIDGFEKLLRMGLKANQQQEIVIVILDCCLQEKTYNPFYAFLAQKLCEHHRSYQMSFQFSIWDRFKEIGDLTETNRHNFGKLLSHLIIQKALSLSILKVVDFGTVQKSMVRLLKHLLTELLTEYPKDQTQAVFARIAPLVKLKKLHEGLKLFMHHFLIGNDRDSSDLHPLLRERIDIVDQTLSTNKGHML